MLDKLIGEVDQILKVLLLPPTSQRIHPDANINNEVELSAFQKKHVIALMRVNHCGEICAQALYQGQILTAKNRTNYMLFKNAASEETEHLAWTKHRIEELGGNSSILCPLFYLSSLTIGIGVGILGDKWSLGFLEETENQVSKHLETHLTQLPHVDNKSTAILKQMQEDEKRHKDSAKASGSSGLPQAITLLMRFASKIMTTTTYYL